MSLTSDDLQDIKQLMEAVVYQHGIGLKKEITKEILGEMDRRFSEQDEKLDEILSAVGADLSGKAATLDNHEKRITRLEKRAA